MGRLIDQQLAHFQVTAKLGEGGMGEVYRAVDTRLGREVAIKVLPQDFLADPERLARFEREAKVLASLSHPNIAGIHEIGQDEGTRFLVMELVPGENLAERLTRGPLPVEEAVSIFLQTAYAMAAAHDQGIVHRDLKPGNVMVTPDGDVKVLDFGLARADVPGVLSGSAPSMTHSPTMTYEATQAGMLLGTAAYMSPEQAKGQPATRGSDVWALGCLLFEMLSGQRPFRGETLAETLAAVLRGEPDWEALPTAFPRRARSVLQQCLTKDPRRRFHDANDVGLLLEKAMAEGADAPEPAPRPRGWVAALGWIVAFVALIWVGVLAFQYSEPPAPPAPRVSRFLIQPPAQTPLVFNDVPNVTISADGRQLAFVASPADSGVGQIYLRELAELEARPVAGTEGASQPFFSPDGEQLAFFAGGELRRVARGGGLPFKLADAPNNRGAVWSRDGTEIFYIPEYATGIYAVAAGGGSPRLVLEPNAEAGERTLRWVDTTPGHRHLIYTVGHQDSPNDYSGAWIEALSLETGQRSVLVSDAAMARFVPPDRLVFLRDAVLSVVQVDWDSLTLIGEPVPVVQGVGSETSSGAGFFDVSDSGDLLYVPGALTQFEANLVVVDEDGQRKTLDLDPQGYHHPRFSPDGERVSFTVTDSSAGQTGDIWIYTLASGNLERLTFGGSGVYGTWSRDGSRLAYSDLQDGVISVLPADGSTQKKVLVNPEGNKLPETWSPAGDLLAFTSLASTIDIYLTSPGGEPRLFEANASSPVFSPDGRWVAFTYPSSGVTDVFVRPVEGEGQWQVSWARGGYPRWASDRNAIYYIDIEDPERRILRADVLPGDSFRTAGPVEVLSSSRFARTTTAPVVNWDVSPDGTQLIFVEPDRGLDASGGVQVVLGWASELLP